MNRRLLAAAAVLLAFSGCTFLRDLFTRAFRKPTLQFRTVTLGDAALSGITLNTHWSLDNPNSIGLSLAEVDYALFVEGKQVVAGKPPAGLTIPARGSSELVFPANVKFADIAPLVQTFLTQDYARYRAEGHLGVQTPIGILKLPLSYEGQFEVPKLPEVQLGSPRIANLSLQGATLELPLTVTSRNSFELPIGGLSGSLAIAGANVGNLSTGEVGVLPGRGTRQLNLPITVNFASARAAAAALAQGSGTVSFNGQLQSGGALIPISFSQHLSFRR
ncbi:MAG: LEA type 2 family protein [Myxococcales bacterium]|nr:LEA type 2 family protein [Myxococcales bacterium]